MTDTAAIRESLRMIRACALPQYWSQALYDMADEIDRLRIELEIAKRRIEASWETCTRPGGCVPGRLW
jgi:hypothetical protein